jgi:hypothetical protein
MEFRRFAVEGPLEIISKKIEDERGYFSEVFGWTSSPRMRAPSNSCRKTSR